MKRLLMLLIIGIAITSLGAQLASSFRNQSTGGVLDDELDMMFNGVDLAYIQGSHIYTNLSNFEGNDKLFANQDTNRFLLAMAAAYPWNPEMKYALVYKYWDNKTPNSYIFNAVNYSLYGEGDFDQLWQSYDDTNGNGLYDRLSSDRLILSKYSTSSGESFGFNNTWKRKNNIMGLLVSLNQNESGDNYSHGLLNTVQISSNTPTYDLNQLVQTFDENDPFVIIDSVRVHYAGIFDKKIKDKNLHAKLAYGIVYGQREFLIEPSFNLIESESQNSERGLHETITGVTKTDEEYRNKQTDDGFEGKLAVTYRKHLTRTINPKNGAFMQIGIYGGWNSLDTKSSVIRDLLDDSTGNLNTVISSTERNSTLSDGTTAGLIWGGMMKVQGSLGKTASWGIGMDYQVSAQTFDYDYSTRSFGVSETTTDDIFVSSTTTNQSLLGKGKTETTVESLVIPTGLEYWFTRNQKWAFRCGSVFTQSNTTKQEQRTPTSSTPFTTVSEDADGNVSVDVSDNTYTSTVSTLKTKNSNSVMTYGFGFKANDNLQIDLMGVFETTNVDVINTTFFRNLRLSFSYHF
ncbi:MAG: hypothetical protein CVU48_02455 [Candidatus Cloacimonetes bacterium HGW-Cloacimonetes-1]|jgi:hypothetical protein|nr:MAG: hypothetical protein CVU48_02455 [Candidatus Cloacimonetes bacterium HGW-Cloacimonetes-1]